MGEVTPEKVREFIEEKVRKVEQAFWGNVCALYVFGSTTTGRGWKSEKDLDVAVYFSPQHFKIEDGERIRQGRKSCCTPFFYKTGLGR